MKDLEESFFLELERPKEASVPRTGVPRPPIPTFHWSGSDDDDELLALALPKTKTAKIQPKTVEQFAPSTTWDDERLSPVSNNADRGKNESSLKQKETIESQRGLTESLKNRCQSNNSKATFIAPISTTNLLAGDIQEEQPLATREAFILALDHLQIADHATMTPQFALRSLEKTFQTSLTAKTKIMVKKRLRNLVNLRVTPTPLLPIQRSIETVGSEETSIISQIDKAFKLASSDAQHKCKNQQSSENYLESIESETKRGPVVASSTGDKKVAIADICVPKMHLKGSQGHPIAMNPSKGVNQATKEASWYGSKGGKHSSQQPSAGSTVKEDGASLPINPFATKQQRKQQFCVVVDENGPVGVKLMKICNLDCDSFDSFCCRSSDQMKLNVPAFEQTVVKDYDGTIAPKSKLSKPTKPGGSTSHVQGTNPSRGKTTNASKMRAAARKQGGDCSRCKAYSRKNPLKQDFGLNFVSYNPVYQERRLLEQIKTYEECAGGDEHKATEAWRELKRLRRERVKEREVGSRFLPDGKEMDRQMDCLNTIFTHQTEATKASVRLFGAREQTFQSTLTQMFGGTDPSNDTEGNLDSSIAAEKTECTTEGPATNYIEENNSDVCTTGEESANGFFHDFLDDPSSDKDLVCHRTLWRNGTLSTAMKSPCTGGTLWSAIIMAGSQCNQGGSYDCAFNQLFKDDCNDNERDIGIDHLIGLFGDSSSSETLSVKRMVSTTPPNSKISLKVKMSVLMQGGKLLAKGIHAQLASDGSHCTVLEKTCPQWRENVQYAMHQREEGDLHIALANIQQSKARLEAKKDSFLSAWQQQQSILGVFELAINQSLGSLKMSETFAAPYGLNILPSPTTTMTTSC